MNELKHKVNVAIRDLPDTPGKGVKNPSLIVLTHKHDIPEGLDPDQWVMAEYYLPVTIESQGRTLRDVADILQFHHEDDIRLSLDEAVAYEMICTQDDEPEFVDEATLRYLIQEMQCVKDEQQAQWIEEEEPCWSEED